MYEDKRYKWEKSLYPGSVSHCFAAANGAGEIDHYSIECVLEWHGFWNMSWRILTQASLPSWASRYRYIPQPEDFDDDTGWDLPI
jgi:hypothetical protein